MLFSSCTLLTGNGPENGSVSPVFIYEDDGPSAFIVNNKYHRTHIFNSSKARKKKSRWHLWMVTLVGKYFKVH
jgi:hypothetical protein